MCLLMSPAGWTPLATAAVYIININSVKNAIKNCQFALFANDLKLFMKICSLNDSELTTKRFKYFGRSG